MFACCACWLIFDDWYLLLTTYYLLLITYYLLLRLYHYTLTISMHAVLYFSYKSVNYPCLKARACNSTTRSTTCYSCLLPQTLATIGWLTAARLLRFCLTGLCEQSIPSFTVDVYGSGTVVITSVTAYRTAKFMPLSVTVSLRRITTDWTTLTSVLRIRRKDFWLRQRSFVFQHLPELTECPGDHDVPGF